MKRLLSLLLCLIFSISVLFAEEYMKAQFGKVTVEVPSGWLVQSVSDSTIMLMMYAPDEINDHFRERISVTSGLLSEESTVKEYIQELKSNFLSYYESASVLSNKNTHMLITGILNGIEVKQYIKFVVRNKMIYCITATALPETYDYWEPTFDDIIGSVRIKK
ncbi:MAG: hypothetical protein K6G00_00100 [Treponema sp.]|nr:hypothetical protein [Treponema sp.]